MSHRRRSSSEPVSTSHVRSIPQAMNPGDTTSRGSCELLRASPSSPDRLLPGPEVRSNHPQAGACDSARRSRLLRSASDGLPRDAGLLRDPCPQFRLDLRFEKFEEVALVNDAARIDEHHTVCGHRRVVSYFGPFQDSRDRDHRGSAVLHYFSSALEHRSHLGTFMVTAVLMPCPRWRV